MTDLSETQRRNRIRDLNDALRKRGEGGRIMLTTGIQALGQAAINDILNKVRTFDAFSKDNDPWGEHDCAVMTVSGIKVIWKIDYYDRNLEYASPDPANPAVTIRVITILLSQEY